MKLTTTNDAIRESLIKATGQDIGEPLPTAIVTRARGAVRLQAFGVSVGDQVQATGQMAGFFDSAAPMQLVCTTEFFDN
jgi:hypothetical protein